MSETVRTGAFTRTLSFGRGTHDTVQPRFHTEAVQDPIATAKEGRPIFKEIERVQFLMPGSPNQPTFNVNEEHKQRWPEQYAAFKAGREMHVDGTPIEQWPILNRAQVAELKAQHIYTIEQCAELPDVAVQRLGLIGHRLRERAKSYLDDAAAGAFQEELAAELDRRDSDNAALRRQVQEQSVLLERLSAQINQMMSAPHPLATHVPAQHDPLAPGAVPTGPAAPSSLDTLPEAKPRRRAA